MEDGTDARRGAPFMGGSRWSSADIHYQSSSSNGGSGSNSSSRPTKMEEAMELRLGGRVCNHETGKGPECSRTPVRKPSQLSPKLVAACSPGSRRVQRPHHGSLQGQWNVLQGFVNESGTGSAGLDAEANIGMGLNTQLGLSEEDGMLQGHGHPHALSDSFSGRAQRSVSNSLDFLIGGAPVQGSSSSGLFPGRAAGHIAHSLGNRSAASGLPPIGNRQAPAGIPDQGGRNGIDEGKSGELDGSVTSNSLFMERQDSGDRAHLHGGGSDLCGPTGAFLSGSAENQGVFDGEVGSRGEVCHHGADKHSSRGTSSGISVETGAGRLSNVSSSSRGSACKRKSCTPVMAGSFGCRNGSPHRSGFRESCSGRTMGGRGLSRRSTGIAGSTSTSEVVASTSISAQATSIGRCAEPPVLANTSEDPCTRKGGYLQDPIDVLPEPLREGRSGKSVLGSSSSGVNSQRSVRGRAGGAVSLQAETSQPSQSTFAPREHKPTPVLQPDSWGSQRASLAESSMDADESNSSSSLLIVDHMLGASIVPPSGTPSVDTSGSSASLGLGDTSVGLSTLGERLSHRYMGSSTRSLATSASSASELGAAVAIESRIRSSGINHSNLDSTISFLTPPLPADPVSPSMQASATSVTTSIRSPARPPPHPPVLRGRLQGNSINTFMPSPFSSGPAPSRMPPSPPSSAPSALATSMDTLPSPASLFQGSILPRSQAGVRSERGLSSVAESLLGLPFRGLQMSAGDGAHQSRLVAEGLAEILLALECVERDEDLTYEQLLMLEATLLFGGMGLHDQHSDLRLDVDNMSYEELLALEERIGTVSTGVSADVVNQKLKRSQYSSLDVVVTPSPQECDRKCSICQEEYEEGDELGKIDCGHGYHVSCIKQWLVQKNQCPICKAAAFS